MDVKTGKNHLPVSRWKVSGLCVLWDMFQTIGLYRSLGHCFMLLQTSDLFPSAFCPCQNRLLKFKGFKVGNFLWRREGKWSSADIYKEFSILQWFLWIEVTASSFRKFMYELQYIGSDHFFLEKEWFWCTYWFLMSHIVLSGSKRAESVPT